MKPLTILHVNTEPSWRGGEAQTLMLARGLADRGHRSLVALRRGSALEKAVARAGLAAIPLPMRGEFDPASVFGIGRALRDEDVDALHYHTSHAVSLGTLATLIAGRRPAVLTRRVSFSLRRNPLARFKYSYRIDHLIAVADGVRWVMIAEGIAPDRVTVIHSGIDLARFGKLPDRRRVRDEFGIEEGAFLVGSVGHLAAHKGQSTLLEALSLLVDPLPGLRLLMIGEGSERAALEATVKQGRLAGRVVFSGFREDVPELMSSLDMFVLASTSGEGSPAVIKEAMASGVPIVATELDGIREIVEDGKEAILVPPGNSERLAGAVRRVAGDPALRLAMTQAARTRVSEFSSDRMVDRTLEVYRQVTEPRAKGR